MGFAFDRIRLVLKKTETMKKSLLTALFLTLATTGATLMAMPQQDDYLGLPGDNLNLYAVMKLFQESKTLEGFERTINEENSRINNLDLNGDNLTDYINVIDYADGNVHNIVLRVAINKFENQDVAVFTVQRFADGNVQIQLIGDEALYGKNYIIEPYVDGQYLAGTPNPGYTGTAQVEVVRTTWLEIAAWPVVRFIYTPGYVAWQSTWYWGYWPVYWHPWRPYYWHYYYGYHYHWYNDYYRHYHRCDHYRYAHWNDVYYSHRRSVSPYVNTRIRSGHYNATYSHPEKRRDGEALYARTNPDHASRRMNPATADNRSGRTGNQAGERKHNDGNTFSTYRRTNEKATRSSADRNERQSTGTARRSTGETRKSNAGTAAPRSGQSTVRTESADRSKGTTKRETSSYNTFNERRTANTVTKKSAPERADRGTAVKSSKSGSKPQKAESFSNRRSSSEKVASKPAKSSKDREFAAKDKPSGRR